MNRTAIIFCTAMALSFWSSLEAQGGNQLPNDLKWVTRSIEYAALCEQVYRTAWPIVKEKAKKQKGNWVVVFDIDETVLDNSQYALERAALDSGFSPSSWTKWVRREASRPIPGAKAFIAQVRALGPQAHVVFITNRSIYDEEATVSNLRKFGLFQDGDIILCRKSRDDTKAGRRNCVEAGTGRCERVGPMTILALFGDNIRDFMPMSGMENANNYKNSMLTKDPRWGTEAFVLPNPTYGSWENDYK